MLAVQEANIVPCYVKSGVRCGFSHQPLAGGRPRTALDGAMPLFGSAKDLDVRSNNKCSGKDVKKLQKTIQDRFDLTVRTACVTLFGSIMTE